MWCVVSSQQSVFDPMQPDERTGSEEQDRGISSESPGKLASCFQDSYVVGHWANWKLSWKPAQFTGIRAFDNGDG